MIIVRWLLSADNQALRDSAGVARPRHLRGFPRAVGTEGHGREGGEEDRAVVQGGVTVVQGAGETAAGATAGCGRNFLEFFRYTTERSSR